MAANDIPAACLSSPGHGLGAFFSPLWATMLRGSFCSILKVSGSARGRQHQPCLIKPCIRFSRTRLSDVLLACVSYASSLIRRLQNPQRIHDNSPMKENKSKLKKRDGKKDAASRFLGWLTSDEDEIERRRHRGANDKSGIRALESDEPFFGSFLLTSASGETYHIEIRSLAETSNSCDCPDHQVNGLGTCKHVEAVLLHLRKRQKRLFRTAAKTGSARLEIYLDRRDNRVRLLCPAEIDTLETSDAMSLISPLFSSDNHLLNDPLNAIPTLKRSLAKASDTVRKNIRLSRHLDKWLEQKEQQAEMEHSGEINDIPSKQAMLCH